MNRITEHLTDPGWWFTAVFVAVLVSLAAAFLKDALLTALAKVSKYYRTRKKQRDEEVEKQVNLILNDPILFILSYSKIIFQTSAALTLMTIYSVMYGLYISLPEGVNIKAKLILGSMTILSGAGAIFTMLRHTPRQKIIKTAYGRYRKRVITGEAQQSAPGDSESRAKGASSETPEQ